MSLSPPIQTSRSARAESYRRHVVVADDPDACWGWTGPTNGSGRGKVRGAGGNDTTAPRYSFETHVRKLAPDEKVIQTCGNPACSNPRHLQPATQQVVRARAARCSA